MQYAVDVGMIVSCCRQYENIEVGCEGKVVKLMRDGGLHDLNVKVLLKIWINVLYLLINSNNNMNI